MATNSSNNNEVGSRESVNKTVLEKPSAPYIEGPQYHSRAMTKHGSEFSSRPRSNHSSMDKKTEESKHHNNQPTSSLNRANVLLGMQRQSKDKFVNLREASSITHSNNEQNSNSTAYFGSQHRQARKMGEPSPATTNMKGNESRTYQTNQSSKLRVNRPGLSKTDTTTKGGHKSDLNLAKSLSTNVREESLPSATAQGDSMPTG